MYIAAGTALISTHFIFLTTSEKGTNIFILQMRKRKHREMKGLAEVHLAGEERATVMPRQLGFRVWLVPNPSAASLT